MNNRLKNFQTAVLVIDVQVDGCSLEGRSVKVKNRKISHIQKILPRLNSFIHKIKDKKVLVIYSRHIEDKNLVNENTRYLFARKNLQFGSYKKGSEGSNLYYVKPDFNDVILDKYTWDLFSNPKLDELLKKRRIKNLIITGVETEGCVFSTISSAYTKGYNVFVPKDLVSTKDHKIETFHKTILTLIDSYYGFLLNSQDILKLIIS